MKKALLFIILGCAAAFAQTPCITQAKAGMVGQCFSAQVPVTDQDAQWVVVTPVPGYVLFPSLNYQTKLEFSSLEQAQSLVELLKFLYPGSVLIITDYSSQFNFPPYRKIQYFNAGGEYSPRMYQISGTVTLNGQSLPISFSAGWFVNVIKLIYGGSYETQALGYPSGSSLVQVIIETGSATPVWVGGPLAGVQLTVKVQ